MATNKSPFKDNNELKKDIQKFLNTHRTTFSQEIDRTSAYFEIAVFNDLVRFYENTGFEVTPKNLKPRKRQFVGGFRLQVHHVGHQQKHRKALDSRGTSEVAC